MFTIDFINKSVSGRQCLIGLMPVQTRPMAAGIKMTAGIDAAVTNLLISFFAEDDGQRLQRLFDVAALLFNVVCKILRNVVKQLDVRHLGILRQLPDALRLREENPTVAASAPVVPDVDVIPKRHKLCRAYSGFFIKLTARSLKRGFAALDMTARMLEAPALFVKCVDPFSAIPCKDRYIFYIVEPARGVFLEHDARSVHRAAIN